MGHVTNSIEPVGDAVAVIIWVALPTVVRSQTLQIHDPNNSINIEYDLCIKTISPGMLVLYYLDVVFLVLPDRARSTIPVAHKRSITDSCIPVCPATLLLLKLFCKIPTDCHLSATTFVSLTIT